MSRKQNIMVAALVTAALVSAWFFADVGRAPFSRKGMAAPTEVSEAAPEQEREVCVAPTEEDMERLLDELEQRTALAKSVQGAPSAKAFITHVREHAAETKVLTTVVNLLFLSAHGGEPEPVVEEHQPELEEGLKAYMEAVNSMYNRLWKAGCYGDPVLQDGFALCESQVIGMAIHNILIAIENRRDMAEWEQRQAEEAENAAESP